MASAVAVALTIAPERVSRGKNGLTSNGIFSRAAVMVMGATLINSTRLSQALSLTRPPSGRAAIRFNYMLCGRGAGA